MATSAPRWGRIRRLGVVGQKDGVATRLYRSNSGQNNSSHSGPLLTLTAPTEPAAVLTAVSGWRVRVYHATRPLHGRTPTNSTTNTFTNTAVETVPIAAAVIASADSAAVSKSAPIPISASWTARNDSVRPHHRRRRVVGSCVCSAVSVIF